MSKLRIAVTGGGIAGASLAHGLSKYPHLDVHVFEAAPQFKDSGAAIGLTANARAALHLLGASAVQCFERAGAVPQKGAEMFLAQGPDVGTSVGRMGGDNSIVSNVHRAVFVQELLATLKPETMHASKKLTAVEQAGETGPVTLRFADGSAHECDVLIGADGIHSNVRKYILGPEDLAASPVPAGYWFVLVLAPYEEVAELLGKTHLDSGEVAWVGDGAVIFHNKLSDGKVAQLATAVACGTDDPPDDWKKVVTAEEIRATYKDWPTNLYNAVDKLICNQPTQNALYAWEHLPARTYVKGGVAIVGDAAHATTPWQGSGAGMSIEDSLIVSTLLGHAKTPAEAQAALKVYDAARRERTQKIVESSRNTGKMVTNRHPETGLEAVNLKEKLRYRWDFILDFDVAGHQQEVLRLLEDELKK